MKNLFGIFFRKWKKGIQSVSVFTKSYRHNRYALKLRCILHQIPNASLQLFSVVNSFTEYDLTIHRNAALIQPVHLLQRLSRKTVVKHLTPKFRIRRLKRYIDRLQMIPDNPVNIVITHIGKRHIIPLKERKSGIIIFKIQCFTHIFWHLIDKAEDTFIPAGTVLIHQSLFKLNPQIFLVFFLNLQFPLFSVRLLNKNGQIFLICKKMIIKNIFDLLIIDRKKLVSCRNLQFLCDTARKNIFYNMCMCHKNLFPLFDSTADLNCTLCNYYTPCAKKGSAR